MRADYVYRFISDLMGFQIACIMHENMSKTLETIRRDLHYCETKRMRIQGYAVEKVSPARERRVAAVEAFPPREMLGTVLRTVFVPMNDLIRILN